MSLRRRGADNPRMAASEWSDPAHVRHYLTRTGERSGSPRATGPCSKSSRPRRAGSRPRHRRRPAARRCSPRRCRGWTGSGSTAPSRCSPPPPNASPATGASISSRTTSRARSPTSARSTRWSRASRSTTSSTTASARSTARRSRLCPRRDLREPRARRLARRAPSPRVLRGDRGAAGVRGPLRPAARRGDPARLAARARLRRGRLPLEVARAGAARRGPPAAEAGLALARPASPRPPPGSLLSRPLARVFVITGPSGVGKGTLIRGLMERLPELELSVSATTRSPRPGEQDGVDYHFLIARGVRPPRRARATSSSTPTTRGAATARCARSSTGASARGAGRARDRGAGRAPGARGDARGRPGLHRARPRWRRCARG